LTAGQKHFARVPASARDQVEWNNQLERQPLQVLNQSNQATKRNAQARRITVARAQDARKEW